MRVESQQVEVNGHSLHRVTLHPEPSVPLRAVAIFYHGQGDYADRYPDVLEIFTKHGIRCIITDMLGHGHSPGVRGHVGDECMLDAVLHSSLKEVGDLPYGVMGHSMGGLLALRHLVLAGKGLLPNPKFSWVSSPLVKPEGGRSAMFRRAVGWLSLLFPRFTISTGVTAAMCRVTEGDEKPSKEKPKHPLWHRRVSLGWGIFLIQTSEWIHASADHASKHVALLMTQGSDDFVCPPEKSRYVFDQLGCRNKTYLEIEGMLHEPFSGVGKSTLYEALENWLDELSI